MTAAAIYQQDGMIAKVAYGCPSGTQYGIFCLSWPQHYDTYYYDYVPPNVSGAMDDATPVCHRSEEIVRVPSGRGRIRKIKIIRCP
jgi:hypothetical protein